MILLLPLGPEEEDLGDAVVERPWVTWGLAALCVVVHLLVAASHPETRDLRDFWMAWGYRPDLPAGLSLVSYQFLHGDFWHLLGNGIFLLAFGTAVEKKLGHPSMVLVYLLSGVGAGLFWGQGAVPRLIEAGGSRIRFYAPLIGASGAVAGLIGCLLPAVPTMRMRILVGMRHYWKVVPVQAWIVTLLYFAKELLMGSLVTGGGVAYGAHVGGLLTGAFAGALVLPGLARLVELARDRARAGAASSPPARSRPALPAQKARKIDPSPVELPLGASPDETLPPTAPPVAELVAPRLEGVPKDQDLQEVSGQWAQSWDTADLQRKFHRARAMEKDPVHGANAFRFYQKVLKDRRVPGGHRAYAGIRLASMLYRAERFDDCLAVTGRLLQAGLPPHIEEQLRKIDGLARQKHAPKAQ